jgi:hypothetical protein
MCAGDQETIDRCELIGHPGSMPALTEKMTVKIAELKAIYQQAHDGLGMSVLGKPGINAVEMESIVDELRRALVDYAGFCRTKTIELLS